MSPDAISLRRALCLAISLGIAVLAGIAHGKNVKPPLPDWQALAFTCTTEQNPPVDPQADAWFLRARELERQNIAFEGFGKTSSGLGHEHSLRWALSTLSQCPLSPGQTTVMHPRNSASHSICRGVFKNIFSSIRVPAGAITSPGENQRKGGTLHRATGRDKLDAS
ncbi:hypothetical protein GHT73_27160 [Pseudomonas aeruginosa]|nr:hypothetical protein [Pseudomonas aeruginosa]